MVRRRPATVLTWLLVGLAVATGPAASQVTLEHARSEIRLTELLLRSAVGRHTTLAQEESAARQEVAASADQLAAGLASTPVAQLRDLEQAHAEARARLEVLETAAREVRGEIYGLRSRLDLLRSELARRSNPTDLPDPLTGAWLLTLEPQGIRGLMDLELDATLVSGTVGLGDGTFGSIRGTFVRGEIRLERVSAEGGLDLVFEGRYDPVSRTLAGNWRPTVHGRGEPAGGEFVATPREPDS
jgi:hypothetical protein